MTDFEVVELDAESTAVLRAEVPMPEIRSVFDRGFGAVMAAVAEQGLEVTGPPFGYYPRMPGETVAVAVGFPVAGRLEPSGEVEPMDLPGGRAVRGIHVGSYDSLGQTYEELVAWATEQGLELAEGMWESYLTDPSAEPDQSRWRTLLTWPLAS